MMNQTILKALIVDDEPLAHMIILEYIKDVSFIEIVGQCNLATEAITFLQNQFDELRKVAEQTDTSFIGAVNAQEKKQINGLKNLEKRLLKAEKRRLEDLVSRITAIQNQLLPNGGLEERQRNFSEYYLEYGPKFILRIKNELKFCLRQSGNYQIIKELLTL